MSSPQWWAKGVRLPAATVAAFPAKGVGGLTTETPGISIELFNPDGSRLKIPRAFRRMGGGVAHGPRTGQRYHAPGSGGRPTSRSRTTWFGLMFRWAGGGSVLCRGPSGGLDQGAMNRLHRLHDWRVEWTVWPGPSAGGGLAVVFRHSASPTPMTSAATRRWPRLGAEFWRQVWRLCEERRQAGHRIARRQRHAGIARMEQRD